MGDFKFEVWPSEYRVITQHFGVNPRNYAQFGLPGHDGIDIRAPSGSKVFCVAPGEVFRVHSKPTGHNYGIHVRVLHQDGYKTIYAHLEKVLVTEGQIVAAGTVLGLADNTGNSFGAHLHITLKKTGARYQNWPYEIIDPTPFLLPLIGWKEPAGPYHEGYVLTDSLFIREKLAQVNAGGATIYFSPEKKAQIPAGSIVIVLGQKAPYTQVKVPQAAIGLVDEEPPTPAPEPPALVATIDGWAWQPFLTIVGTQGIVGSHGVNLREDPTGTSRNIGLVKAKSTVSLLGPAKGRYLPVRVRRNDFMEPVNLPQGPLDSTAVPSGDGQLGWVLTQYLSPLADRQALTSRLGVNLRSRPDSSGQNVGLVKAYATVRLAGPAHKEYTPVLVKAADLLNLAQPLPDVLPADPWPDGEQPSEPKSIPNTVPGWAFTNGLYISGDKARVAKFGSNLRLEPRRDARALGFIPAESEIVVTGPAQGEYTPVRVRSDILEPPKPDGGNDDPDQPAVGTVDLGLHASADPVISEAEFQEFASLRPSIIKVLSFHSAEDIRRLASAHPQAQFIIRAFLSVGGRKISPGKFVEYTLSDVRRALAQLKGHQVVVELHNEPNLYAEGLGSSWDGGAAFSLWWRELLKRYRQALPNIRFIYPGLSPGSTISGVKLDHIRFIETSREAVEAADGLGVHLYWSELHPMSQSLDVLDDYISRFRAKPIWITEASRNDQKASPAVRAQEYLRFWQELQSRPIVQGVTYFVASASNPKFSHEVWVGNGIGKLLGRR